MIVRARDMKAWEYQPLGPFLSKNHDHDLVVDRYQDS